MTVTDDPGELSEIRLHGERVWRGRVLAVDVDRVRLADGRETVRDVVRHPGAVVIVPLFADTTVLLERQYRYAAGEVLLELPAGTLETGEAPLECARRELAEETGHVAGQWEPLATFYAAPGFCDERMHAYLATELTAGGASHPDHDERIDLVRVPLDQALRLVDSGEIRDAKSIVALLLLARRHSLRGQPPDTATPAR